MQKKKPLVETITIFFFILVFTGMFLFYWFLGTMATIHCERKWKYSEYTAEFRYFEGCMLKKPGMKEKPAFVIEKYSD